ncbi:V-type ATP synthase subunit I [Bacteroides heparinolyticus]|uniref:V-type ATP synthase subunit I n=1 Tax=Prevotella heparinolytica TaxID=28113 RepID=UPI0035A0A01E
MITKMKKLTFLVYHKEYEPFLDRLRELGVVHIVEKQRGEPDEALHASLAKRTVYRNLLADMRKLADMYPSPESGVSAGKEQAVQASSAVQHMSGAMQPAADAETLRSCYERLQDNIQKSAQRVQSLERDAAQLEVCGDFDWQAVHRLQEAGWNMLFYTCQNKDYVPEWEEQYDIVKVAERGGYVYFVVVAQGAVELFAEAVRLPSVRLSELKARKVEAESRLAQAKYELSAFCRTHCEAMEAHCDALQDDIDLMTVKLNGERILEGAAVLLEGWIPVDSEAEVRNELDASGVYYELKSASKADPAPIKLKNNAFTRMYEVLTRMYGMPEYAEFDPTPMIAPFFTLFFAYCMGDAGYGIILILLGFYLKRKLSASMRGMMNLVITLGVATMLLGAVFGTFFGANLFDMNLPEELKQFMITGKVGATNYDKTMLLALIIGVVHVIVGMTVKAIVSTVRFGFKDSLSAWAWLLLVVGFIATGALTSLQLIPQHVSTWAFLLIGGVSAVGIYLLNNLRRNVFVNIGAGLWDTYNMATGLMGDILSYIRLYALGLAGGMLGGVFNQLAFMVNDAAGPVLGWFFCLLILVFGHTLNIGMSCLSAFVHPLRLTFVEYFKNSGYEGRGEAYKPFGFVKK